MLLKIKLDKRGYPFKYMLLKGLLHHKNKQQMSINLSSVHTRPFIMVRQRAKSIVVSSQPYLELYTLGMGLFINAGLHLNYIESSILKYAKYKTYNECFWIVTLISLWFWRCQECEKLTTTDQEWMELDSYNSLNLWLRLSKNVAE